MGMARGEKKEERKVSGDARVTVTYFSNLRLFCAFFWVSILIVRQGREMEKKDDCKRTLLCICF